MGLPGPVQFRRSYLGIPWRANAMYAAAGTWQIGAKSKPPGGPHAVSNHDRRLAAEARMAGRAQHALGAVEIQGRRADARQARRHPAGGEAAGGCRRRHRHRGRAGAAAFRSWLSGKHRRHRLRPQGRNGNPQGPLQGDGAAGGGATAAEGPRPCLRGPGRPGPYLAQVEIHPARTDDHHRHHFRQLLRRPGENGVRLRGIAQRGSPGLAGRRRRRGAVR